ncbi:hypothetical protein PHYPSEUDO_011113 [Phytophthora pseudosyringae]|uniref:C2 domain-containing protein n=1 Tax=Phytophthora pseudosyringae TaxID=221518 RepID=A0A8T1W705_9STRA|nr:hypothetical protein PHYPSEUDO_011113 [Phytophthora pseudosyringae]
MQAPGAPPLRLRLLDPCVGVVSGGTRLLLHGAGFRPPPHALTVRFRVQLQDPPAEDSSALLQLDTSDHLSWTHRQPIPTTVDVGGRFLLDSQLECVLPSFERQAARAIAARTSLAASSASVRSAPHVVPLSVEVLLDGGERRSNALMLKLHQPLEIRRVCPQSVLMASPAGVVTMTLNLLKLPTTTGGQLEVLEELHRLPVFVRIRHASERTGTVSEQTRDGRWTLSPLGAYEVEFDAATMGFGAASVELTLNRVDFFRCRSDAPPDGFGYRVLRDVALRAVEPACVSVTSGLASEVRLLGDGFVDTGDIVVRLLQNELPGGQQELTTSRKAAKEVQVAQLNATYYGTNEVRCTVPANLPFGCTSFSVSLNGGRQFGQARVVGLLHRDRALEEITPASSSLAGGTPVTIRHSCLTLEDVDAMYQLQRLDPPRRVRVRFQPSSCSTIDGGGGLAKIVTAEASPDTPGVLLCKTPNFMENIKALNGMRTGGVSERDEDSVPYMWRFTVAVSLGGEFFQGALPFSFYLPPVIRSLTQHHGPSTGDTCVKLRMKHKVPPRLKLLVRFSTLDFTKSRTVEGRPVERQMANAPANPDESDAAKLKRSEPSVPQSTADENPEYFISCKTPPWAEDSMGEVPHLTIVQVSYDAGVTFFPAIDPPTTATLTNPLAKDLSYLCFLFYPPPVVRSAIPLSADTLGGSYIRLQGKHLVDHGAQASVIFESPSMSRKVTAFVEKGELRCCAPPFNVGLARVFVSLNGEQYTLCELHDSETNALLEFIFYSSPIVTSIRPLCACVRQPSELTIFGTNLIETERIKVRVSFPASAHGSGRRLVFKDVPGTARGGVITATTPTFPDEYANQNAHVDVALNGADFSGSTIPLRYFSKYAITRIDPPLGAFEVPVTLTVLLAPVIVTDKLLLRMRLGAVNLVTTEDEHLGKEGELETVYGPVEASSWTASSVEFKVPPLSTLVESLPILTTAHVEVSFDGVHFHSVGNLRDHYRVYNMPQLTSASPLFGVSDRETKIVAHGVHMKLGDVVKLTMFLESSVVDGSKGKVKSRRSAAREAPVPVVTVIAEVNTKRQRMSWTCPSLVQLRASPDRQFPPLVAAAPDRREVPDGMLLPERVVMQLSVVDGQPTSLPFVFRYYRAATLVTMSPRVGYVCSGSLVSFEFAERIATPTVDFRFGDSLPMSGRIRDERFVECFSPELSAGSHSISISFNEQHYEPAVLVDRQSAPPTDNEPSAATFHAFPLPVFVLPPAGRERVYAFGPTSGGTVVVIKGVGFVPATKIYVRFASAFNDAFDGAPEIVVSAKVVDNETIRCMSPPSSRLGRSVVHVSYNLQQFSDTTCFFEYHAPTRYVPKGTLCGPISGQTPLQLIVEDTTGLPSLPQLLQCVVRFESEKHHASRYALDIAAQFDPETRVLSCITPAWSSNELVALRVSLSRGDGELFEDTRIKFLFYDPPEGVIQIEPAAGPIGGGTQVLAWCGSIVDTGEITVSIQLSREEAGRTKKRPSFLSTQTLPPILVRGEIVRDAVRFVAPPVEGPCTAVLSISLNGINYTSTQSPLHFTYYVEPTLRRINPGWATTEGANDALVLEGEHIRDFGCKLLVRFSLQDDKQPEQNGVVVDAQFIANSMASATGDGALQCVFPAAPQGFYELEVSLNGQQFTRSLYVSKTFGNLSGAACTALLPFRHFSSPFCLATATGPAAGGSTVVLFLGGKLCKILSREAKCQVQFTPIRGAERVVRLPLSNPNSGAGALKAPTNVAADVLCVLGEIDHVNARVTCRAPLLRVACVSHVDILLPSGSGASSACHLFGVRQSEREKYYSYESPSITEIAPSCGPTSGGTQLVIEGANILDTAQIFVRFRSSLNERDFVLVPARYSRTFPGGSASTAPLIICTTPPVEFVDKVVSSVLESAAQSTTLVLPQAQASPRVREGATTGKARTQTYQMLAEQSLKVQRASVAHGNNESDFVALGTLRITRPSVKATTRGNSEGAEGGATVLVDFTLNAGEQFIAHSVRFHYYQDIEPRQAKWSPRHLPTQCLGGRQASDSRLLTVTLPKAFRLTDSPERVCFRFDGVDGNPQLSKRRTSFVSLQETDSRTELAMTNPPKVQRQSTLRRPSTYFKNSIMSSEKFTTSPPMTPRSESIETPVSSRRPALGAPANTLATPDPSPPRPTTSGSSPCIAAKVISANEVTCVVPEFSHPGAVQLFFSPNAQQFVCLGELLFHPAMTIKDEFHHATFGFCSNVGGSAFALQCSPSTVLKYLAPEDMTTADKKHADIQNLGLRKCSVALAQARSGMQPQLMAGQAATTINEDDVESHSDQDEEVEDPVATTNDEGAEAIADDLKNEGDDSCELSLEPFERWQKRSIHSAHVLLVPANAKLMKRVTMTATRVDNQSEAGKMAPDDAGCCAFGTSNWSEQVLLSAALPPSCGYSPYSSVLELSALRERKQPSALKTHLVLTQLPAAGKLHVAVICPCAVQLSVLVCDGSGSEVLASALTHSEPEVHENTRTSLTSVDSTVLLDSACDVSYVCVRFGATDNEVLSASAGHDGANIQVLVSNNSGVLLCLCGPPVESAVWIVGRLSFLKVEPGNASASPSRTIEGVDTLIPAVQDSTTADLSALKDALMSLALSPKRSNTMSSPAYTVPVTFEFTSTDSSRSVTASTRARLLLSASDKFQTLLGLSRPSQIQNGTTVTLECAMPPLPFSGTVTLVVSCGGVVFSNSVTVHCYDPRSWRVTALWPSCGQLPSAQDQKEPQEAMTLRLKGEHFVENRKIVVRVSDKGRYFTAPGKVDQVHVLSLRIAAVKNLRLLLQPLGIVPQASNAGANGTTSSPQKREDKYLSSVVGGTTGGGSIVALVSSWSTFTFTLRIECGDQRLFASCREVSVLAAISSGSVLSWEEEFEVRIGADRRAPLLLTAELSEPSLPKPLELAQAWVPLTGMQQGSSDVRRYTARFEEHFKRGNYGGGEANSGAATEVDLLLQLSPPILHPEYIVSQLPYPLLLQLSPQTLDIQVSSGDGFYSVPHSFVVYKPPTVTHTAPSVLPRTAGGDVLVSGAGFVNSGRVCVRLFAFKKNRFRSNEEEQRALATINRVKRFQRTESTNDGFFPYFARDVEGTFISGTSLKFRMPSYLTSFNVYYSVSFDGRSFTEASQASSVLMFSISAVTPKGGPISGNTYTTLHGTNIDACLSLRSGLTPLVRVTWKRGARDLEHVMVPGEFYPHEDAVYFYSPQSKFGLYSVAVNVELALVSPGSTGATAADTTPRFGRDEVSFVMYKTPTIKSVTPLTALVSGLSTTEIIVQGFEEKAVSNMRLAPKLRFKRRGQMQVSDAQLVSESRFECVVPRFNVTNAVATDLPLSALSGLPPVQKLRAGGGALSPRRSNAQLKLWTRTAGIFVALLGARNLRVSKKNACNPFAVVYAGKTQLKSTRKDGVFSPVWNELFDFEWASDSEASSLASVRVVLENQLTADQSESLGHVELKFPVKDKLTKPFALRAWLPLRRIRGKYARKEGEEAAGQAQQNSKAKKPAPVPATVSLGEVELAIAFVPPVAQAKKHKNALRSSVISVISTHPQPRKPSQGRNRRESGQAALSSKKEKLLRAFRPHGAPVSLVPTELAVELALNGQDFWSVAPSTCYSVLTPIVIDVEPKFICIAGGSTLYVSGNNFVSSGCLRVAFAVLTDDDVAQTLRSERTVVVEAKYRSSTSLVCTTPPLVDLATEASDVNIYVSLNGTDFDSIALPKQLVKLSDSAALVSYRASPIDERIEENDEAGTEEPPRKSPRKAAESDSALTLVTDQYVVDYKKVISLSLAGSRSGRLSPTRLTSSSRPRDFLLVPQIRVYLTPKITRARPTDGVYTSHLTIDGTNFTDTGSATARFTSQAVDPEVRTARLLVVSSTRMECSVPDFPRGVLVRIAVAMNGAEFVPCPGELRVFQSPRLTELFPCWVSASTTLELELRGINLTAVISATSTGDNNRGQQDTASVQVSFSGTRGKKVIRGVCEDGKVRCAIPREILHVSTLAGREKGASHSAATVNSPILVDIWLGGKHNAFTGSPLPLQVYREIPTVHLVSPMDGPVYGGFAIVVEGRGFVDTGKIVVRFQLYTEQQEATPRTEDESPRGSSPPTSASILENSRGDSGKEGSTNARMSAETPATTPEPVASYVDVGAKFVSAERVLCPAPSFPQEGVYTVLVALNCVEFSRVSDGSWFLAWQNWQKRKRLLSHALFSRATAPEEAASAAAITGAAAASASLHEDDVDRLRRKSSFMLPKIRSALASTPGESSSASFKAKSIESVSEDSASSEKDTEDLLLEDPRLLQWHPTSTMEVRVTGRPLLSLLEYLCAVRETQQPICRRLRVAFRLKSTQSRDETDSAEEMPALRFTLFVEAVRMIFPNALMRELEELWHAPEHRPDGTMTIKQLLRRLLRNAPPDQRSKSPEPGPTHYEPRYNFVASRETAAIIFPPVAQPEHKLDPPSALFIDYDATVQVIKPRPPRTVFRKRKFNTSWCNPVVEGAAPPSPRPPSQVNRSRPSPRTRLGEDAAEASDRIAAATDSTIADGPVDSDDDPQAASESIDAPQQGATSKEDAVRTPRTPAQATIASSNGSSRSPRRTKAAALASPPSPPPPPANPSTLMPRQANLSGPNPFYNDITPLYAKFLNSTEVKRFLQQ